MPTPLLPRLVASSMRIDNAVGGLSITYEACSGVGRRSRGRPWPCLVLSDDDDRSE